MNGRTYEGMAEKLAINFWYVSLKDDLVNPSC